MYDRQYKPRRQMLIVPHVPNHWCLLYAGAMFLYFAVFELDSVDAWPVSTSEGEHNFTRQTPGDYNSGWIGSTKTSHRWKVRPLFFLYILAFSRYAQLGKGTNVMHCFGHNIHVPVCFLHQCYLHTPELSRVFSCSSLCLFVWFG